jgi:hypothetical protein
MRTAVLDWRSRTLETIAVNQTQAGQSAVNKHIVP